MILAGVFVFLVLVAKVVMVVRRQHLQRQLAAQRLRQLQRLQRPAALRVDPPFNHNAPPAERDYDLPEVIDPSYLNIQDTENTGAGKDEELPPYSPPVPPELRPVALPIVPPPAYEHEKEKDEEAETFV